MIMLVAFIPCDLSNEKAIRFFLVRCKFREDYSESSKNASRIFLRAMPFSRMIVQSPA